MKKMAVILGFCAILNAGMRAWAYSEATLLHLDSTYDQELQYEASADKTVTPAKVLHWIMGLNGQQTQTAGAPSSIDFQPTVGAHDGQVRFVAAIAYKF